MDWPKTIAGLVLAAGLAGAAAADDAKPRDSRTLYNLKCALCHGKDGAPSPVFVKKGVLSLKDAEWQAARSDAQIRKTIMDGSGETLMRGFKDEMSAVEIDAMVAFVRKLGPAKP
jgi:mono/diheme cytochrome c family protein